MLDKALRLHYLEIMGIDVWVPRDSQVPTSIAYDQPDIIAQIEQGHNLNTGQCTVCALDLQTQWTLSNKQADWLLIVEAPNADDSMQCPLFEKNAGLLLAEMLRAIDLSYEDVSIVPLVTCKAVNQNPETQFCMGHLISQQQLIQPKIILAIGDKAAQALFKTRQPLASLRGQCHYINKIPVVVVEHPAYLLRSLLEKRQAWQDLCFAKQILNNEG